MNFRTYFRNQSALTKKKHPFLNIHCFNNIVFNFTSHRSKKYSLFLSAGLSCITTVSVYSAWCFNYETETLSDTTHVCDGLFDLLKTGNYIGSIAAIIILQPLLLSDPKMILNYPKSFKLLQLKFCANLC